MSHSAVIYQPVYPRLITNSHQLRFHCLMESSTSVDRSSCGSCGFNVFTYLPKRLSLRFRTQLRSSSRLHTYIAPYSSWSLLKRVFAVSPVYFDVVQRIYFVLNNGLRLNSEGLVRPVPQCTVGRGRRSKEGCAGVKRTKDKANGKNRHNEIQRSSAPSFASF